MKRKSKAREELLIELEQARLAEKMMKNFFESYRRRVYSTFFKKRIKDAGLTEEEVKAFKSFWGLDGKPLMQAKEVAREMNIHYVKVSQLTIRATQKFFKEGRYAVEMKKQSVKLKRVKGERSLLTLRTGDLLVTPRATLVKVLNASGRGEGKVYGLSYEVKDPSDEGVCRFSEYLTAFELNDRGYTILT